MSQAAATALAERQAKDLAFQSKHVKQCTDSFCPSASRRIVSAAYEGKAAAGKHRTRKSATAAAAEKEEEKKSVAASSAAARAPRKTFAASNSGPKKVKAQPTAAVAASGSSLEAAIKNAKIQEAVRRHVHG